MTTIDGVHLTKDLGIKVLLDIDLPALSGTVDETLVIPGRHGVYDFGAYLEAKPHGIPCRIRRDSMAEVQRVVRELNRLLLDDWGKPKTVKLSYDLESGLYYNVRYSGSMPIQRLASMGDFTLPLMAFDPAAYSHAVNHEIHWDSETVTFDDNYSFETVYVENQQITGPTTVQTFVNGYALRPTMILTGSADSVTFTMNGKSFALPAFTNDEWQIHGQNYTVLRNKENVFMQKIGKDWPELLPGLNDIEISGTNLNFTLSVRVRDREM